MKTIRERVMRPLNIVLLIGSSVMSLLAVELFLATFFCANPIKPQEVPGEPIQSTVLFQYDGIAGWDAIPGIRRQVRGVTFSHNSLGLRGPEISPRKANNAVRVLVLGDSQAYGNELPDNQTISEHINFHAGNLEAINLGISGYGIDQSLLRFIAHGVPLQPDYAAFVLFPENDLAEITSPTTWGAEKPIFHSEEGEQLCLYNSPPARVAGWPNNSVVQDRNPVFAVLKTLLPNLSSFITSREWRPSVLTWLKQLPIYEQTIHSSSFTAHVPCIKSGHPNTTSLHNQVSLATKIFTLFDKIAAEHGVKLLVLIKPVQSNYSLPAHVNSPPLTTLISALQQRRIAIIDLAPRLRQKALPESQLFISGYHLSGQGNFEVAEVIREWINAETEQSQK